VTIAVGKLFPKLRDHSHVTLIARGAAASVFIAGIVVEAVIGR
jgi:hypothetical protein